MVKTTTIQVRLTDNQKKRAIECMHRRGKTNMSEYIRSLIINPDRRVERMVEELHSVVVGGDTVK